MSIDQATVDTSSSQSAPQERDVDALYDSAINSPGYEIQEAKPEQQVEKTWDLNVNGKTIKAKEAELLKWAAQGRDYPQRMAEINQQRALMEKRQQELSQYESTYKPIDDWAKSNPQQWQKLVDMWKGLSQEGQSPQNLGLQQQQQSTIPNLGDSPEIQALKAELNELKQFKQSLEEEKQQLRMQEEDKALNAEIDAIRKEFPYLAMDQLDESGKSLLVKTLEYAHEKGMNSFSDAFRALNLPLILQHERESGKEQVGKELQKRNKLGLLGTSPTPKQGAGVQPAKNIKNKSYEDLEREVREEYGIS